MSFTHNRVHIMALNASALCCYAELAKIKVEGERLPEAALKMTGR